MSKKPSEKEEVNGMEDMEDECPTPERNSGDSLEPEEDLEDIEDGDDDSDLEKNSAKRFKTGKVEYRAVQLRASVLDNEEGQPILKLLQGRAVVFDKPTPLFQDYDGATYYEQIHHDALNGVDLSNVVLKYNHSEHVPPLASTKAGTMDMKVDSRGLAITARMAQTTQASDIYELVRTGHLDKMSFSFTVANDAYDAKTRTRTIFKFNKMYDVSVVDFPAYEQTSVSARNYIQAQQEAQRREEERLDKEEELKRQAELEAEEARRLEAEEVKKREAEEKEHQDQAVQRQKLILRTLL